MRFLPVVATLADGPAHFDGDPRARERPMAQTLGTLRTLGASVTSATGRDTLPFTVHGVGSVQAASCAWMPPARASSSPR
jgi:3-phosphoshikimate 1-carboxyvinyltransferase